jgi:thiol-disulfide isomerase/thioredoxin
MRKFLTALALAGLAVTASAEDNKADQEKKADTSKKADAPKKAAAPKKAEPTLKAGDAAPPIKVTKWLQGTEVAAFAPGKVYIVEFWATWCGPCVVMMPHLGEMAAEYRNKGVTVIGFTAKDPNNTEEKVAAFVAKRGPKLGYTFAYADDRDTYNAWMTAAGQNGIPCSFVVDKEGKIAYIGHPMYLEEVLPKVVAGSWKVKEGTEDLAKVEKEVNDVFKSLASPKAEDALKAIGEFESRRPQLGKIPYFAMSKLPLLVKAKRTDEAKQMADSMTAKALEQGDPTALRTVAALSQVPEAKDDKEITDRSLKAAGELLKLSGDKDYLALLTAAGAHNAAGDKAKAKDFAQKAVDATAKESAGIRKYVEQQAKKYGVEPKAEKKEPKVT